MKHLLLLLLTGLITFTGCQKEADIPPRSKSGENIFSCKVNGEIWTAQIPKRSQNVKILFGFDPDRRDLGMAIIAYNEFRNERNEAIEIFCSRMDSVGPIQMMESRYTDVVNDISAKADSLSMQYITITRLDTINKVVSGEFDELILNTDDKIEYKLTEGYFDLRYTN